MKETSSSPFFTAKSPGRGGGGGAVGSPAEKRTPAVRVNSCRSSASLSSSSSSSSPPSSSYSLNSSNSSSSYSSRSGSLMMTPPSPFCSSSAIPFSWEQQPGVPKHSHHPKERQRGPDRTLPPPPPLRSNSEPFLSAPRKKRPELRFAADPFAVALMECSKEERRDPAEDEDSPGPYWKGAAASSKARRRTVGLFGFLELYASCKTTCSVADSTVCLPRSGRGMAAYGLLTRRAG